MLKELYVVNESVSSCCGRPAGRCSCGDRHAHNQEDLLGTPQWEFQNPLFEMSEMTIDNRGVSVGRDDDLLGLPTMNFANPLVKAKPASVGNRFHVRDEDEIDGPLPWHFANPLLR